MRVLLVHPGDGPGQQDVYAGVAAGLQANGVDVVRCRPEMALDTAATHPVDVIVVVSARSVSLVGKLKGVGRPLAALLTETPYEHDRELQVAMLCDLSWTNERSAAASFPRTSYLPHGWHPLRHHTTPLGDDEDAPAHDVVFVGAGFPERCAFFNAIDWSGINLGLYGIWQGFGLSPALEARCHEGEIENAYAAALYRRAKIGLNLYRARTWDRVAVSAESLNPRAYELAACGTFTISEYRSEVEDVFGRFVPTFRTPHEAEALIRRWLAEDEGRLLLAAALPSCVERASWVDRAGQMLVGLRALIDRTVAA
jgi:spore maturation protein CgeB